MQGSVEFEFLPIGVNDGSDIATGVAGLGFKGQNFLFDRVARCEPRQQEHDGESDQNDQKEERKSADDVCGVHFPFLSVCRFLTLYRLSRLFANADVNLNGLPRIVKMLGAHRMVDEMYCFHYHWRKQGEICGTTVYKFTKIVNTYFKLKVSCRNSVASLSVAVKIRARRFVGVDGAAGDVT